jgi:translation initiation factor eIF-2B subunit epsilon
VERGCLVGDGVVVGPQATLEPFERLSKMREKGSNAKSSDEEDGYDSELEEAEASKLSLLAKYR